MPTEKRSARMAPASLRTLGIGVTAAVVLFGLGTVAARMWAGQPTEEQPTPPVPTATPVEVPTFTPTVSPTAPSSPTVAPSSSPASVTEARAAYQARNYPKAITLFTQAIAEAKGEVGIAQLQYELGNAYRDNGQRAEAISSYSQASGTYPKLVVAWQARANLYVASGDKPTARTVLEEALRANPGNQDLERDLSVLQLSGPPDV